MEKKPLAPPPAPDRAIARQAKLGDALKRNMRRRKEAGAPQDSTPTEPMPGGATPL